MIDFKTDAQIDAMRPAGALAGAVLKYIKPFVKAGVSTLKLNDLCESYIRDHGAIPAPLNYKGFPKSICTSVNNVVCHGIPTSRLKLSEGDIINIDITVIKDGYHGDTSETYFVGEVSERARKIVDVTRESLVLGIRAVKVDGFVGDIGAAIMDHVEPLGYSVVREFVGHGIGRKFHEPPEISHVGQRGKGLRLKPGMVFTIEPMVNEGHWKTKILPDKWTAVTVDGKLSAQFEHTLAIRSDGRIDVLTDVGSYPIF